ncbi:hypothetical protein ACEWPM_018280 [Roseovarius sp. S4756]|uniref:hypothetical protein n=1 Tax=Roseovarius maritimus TaxID=3342637 RepID=UPI00372CD9E8
MLPRLDLPLGVKADSPGYFVGITLGDAFIGTGARPRTASGYLDGLVSLMCAGKMDEKTLNGLRAARDHFKALGRAAGKLKTSRIQHLMERGGFEYIIQTICRLQDEIDDLPDHAARTEKLRLAVAVLMLLVNKPARAGDVTEWRFGHELCRRQSGEWALDWCQGKTNVDTGAGHLWPETCAALDELVLRGRPSRLVAIEYQKLVGSNLVTGTVGARSVKWTSELVRDAIGIPAHDLRTLAADYLRLHDPTTAVSVIQSHLGHGTRKAGDEYRALAEGDAAAAAWRRIREEIAQQAADGPYA